MAGYPVFEALRAEVARRERAPRRGAVRDLAHAILFYTAGDAVRRSLPEHVPYAEAWGVWERSPETRRLLVMHWQPFLDGRLPFDEAVRRLVAGLP